MLQNELNHPVCKTYSLLWSDFSVSLSATVQTFRNVEDLTDVTICAGGRIFPAHKLVLSAASPLLMELLRNTKCQHPILMLAGIAANDLEIILDFVYRGEINIASDKLQSLLQAAQFLDIKALSPAALVLNPPESAEPSISSVINEDVRSTIHENPIPKIKNDDTKSYKNSPPRKTKLVSKTNETSQFNAIDSSSYPIIMNDSNQSSKINYTEKADIETLSVISQSVTESTPSKINAVDSGEMMVNECEEKKIISDLPVDCKLCGVTIRQSRNLRRHIDQMHSRSKSQQDNRIKRKKKTIPIPMYCNVPTSCPIKGQRVEDTKSSLTDDFSQDSFSQLTEEILNYSGGSESDENSFSNAVTILSTPSDHSLRNTIDNSRATESPPTYPTPRSLIVKTQNSSTLLEGDICLQLSRKNDSHSTIISAAAEVKMDTISSVERYDCSNLDDACHVNDATLKDLENQLFSVCFCSSENI